MARKKTPTFTVEFPLDTSPADDRELRIRREMYRQIYNAVIGESLKNLKWMRESIAFRAACVLPKGSDKNAETKAKRKLRADTFRALNERYKFTIDHMYTFVALCCKQAPHIGDHTESHGVQTTALRAFEAVQRYAFGQGGKPRFKGYRELNSVEGKQDCCLIIREGGGRLTVKWNGLTMPIILNLRNKWQIQALTEYPTKFIRIVWRDFKEKSRLYVQIAKEGISPQRPQHKIGTGVIGIDLGPSTAAIVGETGAILTDLCPTVEVPAKEIRVLQRKMDRSIRASNPEAFNEDGTWKKGRRNKLVKSNTYKKNQNKVANTQRCLAAERKRSHGELANQALTLGDQIKTENVSIKAWQRSWYGKSIGNRAPAAFMTIVERKLKAHKDGSYTEFSAYKTKLSQVDHTTGLYTKKPLSQREHVFPDGSKVQRDLYSGYLARFVEDHKLDVSQCVEHWAGAESLLRLAASSYTKGARGKVVSISPTLLSPNRETTSETPATEISIEPRCPKEAQSKIADVVGAVAEMQRATRAAKSVRLQNARLKREAESGQEESSP